MSKLKEVDDSFEFNVSGPVDALQSTLNSMSPPWRHQIYFSNGLSTSQLRNTGKPWNDRPLSKIKTVERYSMDLFRQGGFALDIGCNIGYNSFYLALKHGMNVTGLEVNQSLISKAEYLYGISGLSGVEFVIGDSEKFERAGYYDMVVHFGTLYHLPNIVGALEMASNNLKIGGVLLLETQCHGGTESSSARFIRGFNNDESNWWALSEGVLEKILDYCGFGAIVKILKWDHPSLDGMHRIIWAMEKLTRVKK